LTLLENNEKVEQTVRDLVTNGNIEITGQLPPVSTKLTATQTITFGVPG